METTNRDAKDLIAELCEVAAGAHRLSAKFAGRINDLEKAGATPEQLAAVTRQYRYMMVGLVRTRAMPDESFLIAETIVRLRLGKRRFAILKLPEVLLEKLARRILRGREDFKGIHEWLLSQLKQINGTGLSKSDDVSLSAFHTFCDTFIAQYVSMRDRYVGFGVDQVGSQHGLLETDRERPLVALPPHHLRPEDEALIKAAVHHTRLAGLRLDIGLHELEAVARLILGIPYPHMDVRLWLIRQTGDTNLDFRSTNAIIERFARAFMEVGGRSLVAEWHDALKVQARQRKLKRTAGEDTNETPEMEEA